jgi:hypothetical protein
VAGPLAAGHSRGRVPVASEIDRAVWHNFETVGLDYDAMVREDEERRSLLKGAIIRVTSQAAAR